MGPARVGGSTATTPGMIRRASRAVVRRPVAVGALIAVLASSASVAGLVRSSASVRVAPAQLSPRGDVSSMALPAAAPDGRTLFAIPTTGATLTSPPQVASTSGSAAPWRQVAPSRRTLSLDLYRAGDFASQARADWCVPAAIQTMAHAIDGLARRSLPTQSALDRRSRALSSSRLIGLGSEPQGWAGVLNRLGYGPYVVAAKRTFADAITSAAEALRLTGRPVGLLVWRGAHAWVMTGFEAVGDPAESGDLDVTAVRVTDPWYPRRMSAWGRSRPPDARIDPTTLAKSFLPWHRPRVRYAELDARYVLVLPVAAASDGSWRQ